MSLSVIIPTLNAAAALPRTLAAVSAADEVVVVDGGSTDGTPELARHLGARVETAPPGRGIQLAAGAASAHGDWLLFLHADTVPAVGWSVAMRAFTSNPANTFRAAAFRFALDDHSPQARRLERMVAWRCRFLGLPYGDQGLLISRRHYDRVGGFRALPLMEDVDLVRRIGRRNLSLLETRACTSAERWRRDGWWRRSLRNLGCLGLYFAGMAPHRIKRIYR